MPAPAVPFAPSPELNAFLGGASSLLVEPAESAGKGEGRPVEGADDGEGESDGLPAEGTDEGEDQPAEGEGEAEGEGQPAEGTGTAAAGNETIFQLPAWAADAPEEFQAHLIKLGGGLLEQKVKLTRQRSAAEEERDTFKSELETTKTELAQLRNAPPVLNDAADPLADVVTTADLDARAAKFTGALTLIKGLHKQLTRAIRDGGEDTIEHNGQPFSLDALEDAQENMQSLLAAVPARREFLARHQTSRAMARDKHPALFTKGSPEAKAFAERLQQDPALARVAGHELLIGDNLTMEKVRAGKFRLVPVAAPAKPAAKPASARPAPAASAAAKPAAPAAKPIDPKVLRERVAARDPEALSQALAAWSSEG